MCGIAGILRVTPVSAGPEALRHALSRPHAEAIPEAWLDTLDASIKHRGPDGQGRFRDRAMRHDGAVVDVAFVQRRLSILDHVGGKQPMTADGVTVVFNGCIYNHRELRRALVGLGHEFASDHSDTEVLVRGWKAWGSSLWERLDGMFAVAVWDHARAELVLARDKAGEKPLYLATVNPLHPFAGSQGVLFGSVAGSLARLKCNLIGDEGCALDHAGTFEWLTYGFGGQPPVGDLESVWPGREARHCSWRDGHFGSCDGWWSAKPLTRTSEPLSASALDAMLDRAVASRLEADVPLGCFLSGGVDSSLIAALAKRRTGTLHTFSVRMPDARYDESVHAEVAARHVGTVHRTLDCDARPADDVVHLIHQIGLPLGDSSLLPTYWVSRAARQQVKVALTGDGGDELFGGYDRYRAHAVLARHGRWLSHLPSALLPRQDAKSRLDRAARLVDAAKGDGYRDLVRIFPTNFWHLISPHHKPGVPAVHENGRCHDPGNPRAPVSDPLRWDFDHYLPDDLLLKVDTASMAVALEARTPFLGSEVMEAALAAPLDVLMPRGERKGLLKQVARRYLPAEIVDRPKQGFAIPIGEWFRSGFGGMKALLMDHLNSVEPFGPPRLGIDLNRRYIQQMVDEHMNNRRDHGQRLYMLLVLSIWAKWFGQVQERRGDGVTG